MTIAHILSGRTGEVVTIQAATRVSEAVSTLANHRIGALPVMEGDKVIGIFSERDVIAGLAAHGGSTLEGEVGAVMTSPAVTVTPETGVLAALSLMTRRRIRHLPVLEGTQLIGFVSIGDLVKFRIDRIEAEAAAMRDYIQSA